MGVRDGLLEQPLVEFIYAFTRHLQTPSDDCWLKEAVDSEQIQMTTIHFPTTVVTQGPSNYRASKINQMSCVSIFLALVTPLKQRKITRSSRGALGFRYMGLDTVVGLSTRWVV